MLPVQDAVPPAPCWRQAGLLELGAVDFNLGPRYRLSSLAAICFSALLLDPGSDDPDFNDWLGERWRAQDARSGAAPSSVRRCR